MSPGQRARVGTSAGFLGVAVVSVASVIAGLAYTGSRGEAYSVLSHWISELGEPGVSRLATAFNSGVIAGFTILASLGFVVSVGIDPVVTGQALGAPVARPDIWSVPILEWAVLGGILAWTALAAWWWRRAR